MDASSIPLVIVGSLQVGFLFYLVPVTGLDLIKVLPPQDKRHLIPKRSIPEGVLLFGS